MAVGDALALLVSRMRNFGPDEFALYHPGGSLGRKLGRVEDVMRPQSQVRMARFAETVRQVFTRHGVPGRRPGAVLIVDATDRLIGIFTDSDLAKLFERGKESMLDQPISKSMTANPLQVRVGSSVAEAIELLKVRKISELPVVDRGGRPVGMIDVTDLIGVAPDDSEE
jgi:arabinose-5-phosphate isomerase